MTFPWTVAIKRKDSPKTENMQPREEAKGPALGAPVKTGER